MKKNAKKNVAKKNPTSTPARGAKKATTRNPSKAAKKKRTQKSATNKKSPQSIQGTPKHGADEPSPVIGPEHEIDERRISEASRESYQKLVNPQNYHEYMRASNFRNTRKY